MGADGCQGDAPVRGEHGLKLTRCTASAVGRRTPAISPGLWHSAVADAMQDTMAAMKGRLAKKTPVYKPIGAKL